MKPTLFAFIAFALFTPFASAEESEIRSQTIDLGIVVSDLDKSIKFYTEAIGLTKVGEFTGSEEVTRDSGLTAGEEIEVKVLALGKEKTSTKLKLMQSGEKPKKGAQDYITSQLGFRYLTVHVTSTKTALARLKKAGVKVLAKGPVTLPGGKAALTVVKDPDGNFVELVGPADHE